MATSSARWAEESTATTMQTMATATMTPIGTTTLKRARSQLVYGVSSEARGRAGAGKVCPLKCPSIRLLGAETRVESLLFAFVSTGRRPPDTGFRAALLTEGKSLLTGTFSLGCDKAGAG